ncbi:transmembrane protein 42-like [Eriocheir sinensis]|uniref:transmembrane protein 42-like n=1 Tax=Eriocheir sinensis TaxID=95602 RepID=UPI0021CAD260|nr:transmembrane protein 42-like [Eriocheir sinensis]XP_050719390.1 transmembrane protein 42-like [Eriocheir sinensis]XP_050719391.1 transmembrane protein 42-like [Eriocheir sinensis]
MKGQVYAVVSGLLAALASLCGKYAMASTEAQDLCEAALLALYGEEEVSTANGINTTCDQYAIVLRAIFFVLMVGVNCVMWTTFTKALRFSSTSLEATITNTAANFFFTAILGQVLFGEIVTTLWWMGTVLILCGLLLMHHASNVPPRKPGTRPKMH